VSGGGACSRKPTSIAPAGGRTVGVRKLRFKGGAQGWSFMLVRLERYTSMTYAPHPRGAVAVLSR